MSRQRGPNWGAIALTLLTLLVILGLALWPRQCFAQRTYWNVNLADLAVGKVKHTHVAVTGRVVYVRTQEDGDVHIKLALATDPTVFIIAECIPKLPCTRPKAGRDVVMRGITRKDPEHGWFELHPLESWSYVQ